MLSNVLGLKEHLNRKSLIQKEWPQNVLKRIVLERKNKILWDSVRKENLPGDFVIKKIYK